jgi:hypothetical protein
VPNLKKNQIVKAPKGQKYQPEGLPCTEAGFSAPNNAKKAQFAATHIAGLDKKLPVFPAGFRALTLVAG